MSQVDCRNSSAAKRARTDGSRLEDDWTCASCGNANANFSFRTTCNLRNCTQPRRADHDSVKSATEPVQPPHGYLSSAPYAAPPYIVPFSAGPAYHYNYGSRLSPGSLYRPMHLSAPSPYSSGSMIGNVTSGAPSAMYLGMPPYGSSLMNGASMPPYEVPFSAGPAYHYNYGSRLSPGSPYRPMHLSAPSPYSSGSMIGNGRKPKPKPKYSKLEQDVMINFAGMLWFLEELFDPSDFKPPPPPPPPACVKMHFYETDFLSTYHKQVKDSEGFDVDNAPNGVDGLIRPCGIDQSIIDYANLAIKDMKFELVRVVKVNRQISGSFLGYYITLEAKDAAVDQVKTFQALVSRISNIITVKFCRPKPATMHRRRLDANQSELLAL